MKTATLFIIGLILGLYAPSMTYKLIYGDQPLDNITDSDRAALDELIRSVGK